MRYSLLFACLLLTNWLLADTTPSAICTISAEAGDDQAICAPGGLVQLNGSVSGDVLTYSWSPTSGLTNPNSLQTQAFVTQTTTYTLTAGAFDPTNNLIVNPDFEQGDVGFTSDYTNSPATIFLPGTYAIVTSPDLLYNQFPQCDDHTTGQGNMMLVNGSTSPGDDIWCQTITVSPNTDYVFSAWVGTVTPLAFANLQFTINGIGLGTPFMAPPTPCEWTEFYEVWDSGNNTTAEICITNLNTANIGNDFALDDIFFGPVCEVTDEVTITVEEVIAQVPPSVILPCNASTLVLDGSGSTSGPNISYQWTTNGGNIVSGENTQTPEVDAPGNYTLTVSFDDGSLVCTAMANVLVIPDPATPFANAVAPQQLDCNNPTVQVAAAGSTQGPTISYQWTTPNGNILGDPNQFTINVNQPGVYELTVIDQSTGCATETQVNVSQDPNVPLAAAVDSLAITCLQDTLQLDGTGSSQNGPYSYLWLTLDGNIVADTQSLSPLVADTGTYTLVVLDTLLNCADSVSVSVWSDQVPPSSQLSPADTLTCLQTTLWLAEVALPDSSIFQFEWSTADGNILSLVDSNAIEIHTAGTYQLVTTNTQNGCTDTLSSEILAFQDQPFLLLPPPGPITCTDTQQVISAIDTTSSSSTLYAWSTQAGELIGSTNVLQVTVGSGGWYTLVATDTLSFCQAQDSVFVSENLVPPSVDAGPDQTLDCTTTSLILNGSGSGQSILQIQWTTPDGSILSGADFFQAEVAAPGTYILSVQDLGNGCVATDTALVFSDATLPQVQIQQPDTLTCQITEVILDGTGSSVGPELVYSWSTSNGQLNGATNGLQAFAGAPGVYELSITDTLSGCTNTSTVVVEGDTLSPQFSLSSPDTLNCQVLTTTLQALNPQNWPVDVQLSWELNGTAIPTANGLDSIGGSAPGIYALEAINPTTGCSWMESQEVLQDTMAPLLDMGEDLVITCLQSQVQPQPILTTPLNPTLLWTADQGQPIAGDTLLSPVFSQAGLYSLLVTDPGNGCQVVDSIAVAVDTLVPSVLILNPSTLTCQETEVELIANGQMGLDYTWSGPLGGINSNPSQPSVFVVEGGWYQVTVSNSANGCQEVDSVWVSVDTLAPQPQIALADTLTCAQPSLVLDGSGSSPAGNISFSWNAPLGNIVTGSTTAMPTINQPGWYILQVEDLSNGCQAADSVQVLAANDLPEVVLQDPSLLSCSVTQVQVDGQSSSSGAEFIYSWSTTTGNIVSDPSLLSIAVDAPGWYTLAIENAQNNCVNLDSVWVLQDTVAPIPQINLPTLITCSNPSQLLTSNLEQGGNAPVFTWTSPDGQFAGPQNDTFVQISSAGSYLLTVENPENGCVGQDSVTVTADLNPPSFSVSAFDSLTCETSQVTLSTVVMGDPGQFSYQWSTVDGTLLGDPMLPTVEAGAVGSYLVSVTSLQNGCSVDSAVVVVGDFDTPIFTLETPDTIQCDQPEILLSVQLLDPLNAQITWSTSVGNIVSGSTTAHPVVDGGGGYQVSVTNPQNGCMTVGSVEVLVDTLSPDLSLSDVQQLTCSVEEVMLEASSTQAGLSFLWNTSSGLILSDPTAAVITAGAQGFYECQVVNPANGCTAVDVTAVLIDTIAPQIAAGPAQVIPCDVSLVTLEGSLLIPLANFSAQWTTSEGVIESGNNTLSPSVSAPGTYQLVVTNLENGCTALDSAEVSEAGITSMDLAVEPANCPGETGGVEIISVFGGTPDYVYSFDGGLTFQQNGQVDNLAPGTYTVVVEDAQGCTFEEVVLLPIPIPLEVDLPDEISGPIGSQETLEPQLSVPASNLINILWTPADQLSCQDCLRPVATFGSEQLIQLQITDNRGCTTASSIRLIPVFSVDIYTPNGFSPNFDGANDYFHLFAREGLVKEIKNFSIWSRWGEQVFQGRGLQPNDPSQGWDGTFRSEPMGAGVYTWFAEVELLDGTVVLLDGDVTLVR
jgi:gliding motility-associated-like protein